MIGDLSLPGRIYLVRHGETEWNRAGRLQGQGDSPLTADGIDQATRAGRLLRTLLEGEAPPALASSPLGRARATAEIVCREAGWDASAIRLDARLKEADYGRWEGSTKAEAKARFPAAWRARQLDRWRTRPPGGESYADLARRAAEWWLTRVDAVQPAVVVTHEMTSRVLRGTYLGLDPAGVLELDHPHESIFVLAEGRCEAHRFG